MLDDDIARICHEANRAYCLTLGDHSQLPWDEAPQWQRSSAVNGVKALKANPTLSSEQMHELWLAEKVADGWTFDPIKDTELKTHPCCRPYAELPEDQRRKDGIYSAIVRACLG